MELNLNNVPEKGHFTISEIAERWEVDESVVEHFIREKSLRLAAYTIDLGIAGLLVNLEARAEMELTHELAKFTLETVEKLNTNKAAGSLFVYRIENSEMELSPEHILTRHDNYHDYPKYLYFPDYPFIASDFNMSITYVATLFDKSRVFFLSTYNIEFETGNYFNFGFFAIRKKIFRYITKEERDRFESECQISGITDVNGISKNEDDNYSSKILTDLISKANQIIREYPTWRDKTGIENIQNTESLMTWIVSLTNANTRDAELIKKLLIEQFRELKKR
jgi:hypothetical protein